MSQLGPVADAEWLDDEDDALVLDDDDVEHGDHGDDGDIQVSNLFNADKASATASTASTSVKTLSRMRLNDDKAGLQAIDKERIDAVIEEASAGSKYYLNQKKRQAENEARIAIMLAKRANATPAELRAAERDADAELARITVEVNRVFVVLDMDQFYAAVEERDDPSLKTKPFAVGSTHMLMTSNYRARSFGIRAGMPGFIARRLNPDVVFVRPNFEKYKLASKQVMAVLATFDEHMVTHSLDEALLDVTGWLAANPGVSVEEMAARMHAQVEAATGGLTCSVGIASNSGCAKIAANMRKPNGTFVVGSSADEVRAFVQALAVNKVPGIGKVLQMQLAALGIETVRDLWTARAIVALLFTPATRQFLLAASIGAFSTTPTSERHAPRKSMSCERTTTAISDEAELMAFLRKLCEKLASDLSSESLRGKSLTVKAKTVAFVVKSRAARVEPALGGDDVERLFSCARELLRPMLPISIRLLGVRVAAFEGQEDDEGDGAVDAAQPRIDSFLRAPQPPQATGSGAASTRSFAEAVVSATCPLCGVDLSGRRAVEASIHVDRCLQAPARKRTLGSSGPPTSVSATPAQQILRLDDFFSKK